MNDKIFKLLNQLKAVQVLLECDGNEMMISEDREKIKQLQSEVDALSAKEVKILNELRQEVLYKEEPKTEKKPKIAKKEVVTRSNGRKK